MSEESDYLLMMTDDQIDYASLTEEVLVALALESDPFIANSALGELWQRKSDHVIEVAWEILKRAAGEPGLESTALHVLFDLDRENALDYMEEHSHKADPNLLNTMATLLLYESDFRYELSVAQKIIHRLNDQRTAAALAKFEESQELKALLPE